MCVFEVVVVGAVRGVTFQLCLMPGCFMEGGETGEFIFSRDIRVSQSTQA